MKKQISFSTKGQRADIGDIAIFRIIPNRYVRAVGPFVFLDHIAPKVHAPDEPKMKTGTGAHPHRGIATLTYLLHGEGEHFDSAGHHAKVNSGGVQWMKAGNGIIHDESLNVDPQDNTLLTHGLQFWINLPAKIKAESPEYMGVQAKDVPRKMLDENAGWIKVIAGTYEHLTSKIPGYTGQFLYHLHLTAGKQFSLTTENGWEYAGFVLNNKISINDSEFQEGEFIEFDRNGGTLELTNYAGSAIDLILFGGEPYLEPIESEGPFVMNSKAEIAQAYRDFFNGKYGKIEYSK
jgi:redox-sensitive bicupin YhaK (pirin superfamily)